MARLISKAGGPVDYLRIVKLIYLADRESVAKRGIPIVGGRYYSMYRGPVISEVMDFVGKRNAPGWKGVISIRCGNDICLEAAPQFDALSESELEILDRTVEAHASRTTDELVEWCHEHCEEYEQVAAGKRKAIEVEAMLRALRKPSRAIRAIIEETKARMELDQLLA